MWPIQVKEDAFAIVLVVLFGGGFALRELLSEEGSDLCLCQLGHKFPKGEFEQGVQDGSSFNGVLLLFAVILDEEEYHPKDRHQIKFPLGLHQAVLPSYRLENCSVFFVDAVGELYAVDF